MREDLKERAAVMDEDVGAGKSIRNARQSFANYKTKMASLRRSTERSLHLEGQWRRQDEYIALSVLPSEIRHSITLMKNCTSPDPDRIRPEHLKNLPPLIVGTLAGLFTRNLSESKVLTSWKTSKTVLLYKKGNLDDIGNYRPFAVYNLQAFTRVVRRRIDRILDEGQPCEQAGFRRGFSIIDHVHFIHHARLIEVSRE